MAFGNNHQIIVVNEPGVRGYIAKCSCGKSTWPVFSYMRAVRLGREHQAKAQKRGK